MMPHSQQSVISAYNVYSPNYSYVFEFESSFDYRKSEQWMKNNWTLSLYCGLLYLCVVFDGKQFMRNRKAYNLKLALTAWNLFLASFSIIGTLRTLPEMIHVFKIFGFAHTVCSQSFIKEVNVSSLWTWLFILSKLPELGDTLFIVARKQKLIFLHWYHHITVLVFTWYSYSDLAATGRWYIVMNYVVHSLMYTYYTLRVVGVRVPKSLALCITTSQTTQMIVGVFVTSYALHSKRISNRCAISYSNIYFGIAIYMSYAPLFAQSSPLTDLQLLSSTAIGDNFTTISITSDTTHNNSLTHNKIQIATQSIITIITGIITTTTTNQAIIYATHAISSLFFIVMVYWNVHRFIKSITTLDNPIMFYYRGINGRTDSVYAVIYRRHLRTGEDTKTDESMAKRVRSRGKASDDCGHIVANILGGRMEYYNLFPQNAHVNRGKWRTEVESNILNFFRHNDNENNECYVTFYVQLNYANCFAKRPDSINFKLTFYINNEIASIDDIHVDSNPYEANVANP